MTDIELNGRQYRLPSQPTVVICADGCDPAYLEAGLAARVLPTIAQWRKAGYFALAEALDYIAAHDGVWFATGEEIVRAWLESGATF